MSSVKFWFTWLYHLNFLFNMLNKIFLLTENGIVLIDGIRFFRLDNNEEEVLCEVGRFKLGDWFNCVLINSTK